MSWALAKLIRLLSETKINNLHDLSSALRILHDKHNLEHIAVSSISLPDQIPDLPSPPSTYTDLLDRSLSASSETLLCFASSRKGELVAFALPSLEGYFSGVGDLFSALVLAFYEDDFAGAVGRALHVVQAILLGTAAGRFSKEVTSLGRGMRERELRIVQAQSHILASHRWPGRRVDTSG